MTNTQYKLAEAEFFLGLMKRNRGKFNKFNFYLSAFSSAAFSVIDVMKRDYTRRPREFDMWFKEAASSRTLEDKKQVALMSNLRQIAVHEGRLNARAVYKIELSDEDRQRLTTSPPVGRLLFSLNGHMQNCRMEVLNHDTGERTSFSSVKVPLLRRYVLECPDQDVLDLCQRFFDLLVPFVTECTQKFGRPPTIPRKASKAKKV